MQRFVFGCGHDKLGSRRCVGVRSVQLIRLTGIGTLTQECILKTALLPIIFSDPLLPWLWFFSISSNGGVCKTWKCAIFLYVISYFCSCVLFSVIFPIIWKEPCTKETNTSSDGVPSSASSTLTSNFFRGQIAPAAVTAAVNNNNSNTCRGAVASTQISNSSTS